MKAGDLNPPWVIDFSDADAAANLAGVTSWRFDVHRETRETGMTLAFSKTVTGSVVITGGAGPAGVLTYAWAAPETAVPGVLHGRLVAVWPGGKEQSFPGEGFARIVIEPVP